MGALVVAARYVILLAWIAAGCGLLALVPLAQFRQIALAMALGILLDTFVVRSLLVPALVVLFGRAGSWPGRTVRPVRRPASSPAAEDLQGSVAHRD
jgi:putative drug exporter of the RND superfamily